MEILYYEMEILIRSVSLYIVSMARMEQLEEAGIDLCMKLPGIALHGVYKVIFYLILETPNAMMHMLINMRGMEPGLMFSNVSRNSGLTGFDRYK